MGLLVLVPFAFLVGVVTSRLRSKIKLKFIRSDIWTTIVVSIVGDFLVEWLLFSLSCLPVPEGFAGSEDYYYGFSWLLQSYGMACPADFPSGTISLSHDATAIMFSLRLVFVCLGVHLGESLGSFVALTGK